MQRICVFIMPSYNFHILKSFIFPWSSKPLSMATIMTVDCALVLPRLKVDKPVGSAQVRKTQSLDLYRAAENECTGKSWTLTVSEILNRKSTLVLRTISLQWQEDNFEGIERIHQSPQNCDLFLLHEIWERNIGRISSMLCPHKQWTWSPLIPECLLLSKAQITQLCLMFILQNSCALLFPALLLRDPQCWNVVI